MYLSGTLQERGTKKVLGPNKREENDYPVNFVKYI